MTVDRRPGSVRRPSSAVRLSGGARPGAPTFGALRLVRGAAVGGAAIGLSLASHVVAGGPLPTSRAATGLVALTVAGSVALSGRRWTMSALLTVLLGVQVAFHVAFGDHQGAAGMAGHHAAHSMSASMVLAHLLAAVVTALLLSRGESWCWRLVALLSRPAQVARAFGEGPAHVAAAGPLLVRRTSPMPRSLLLVDAQPRRGPPVLLGS